MPLVLLKPGKMKVLCFLLVFCFVTARAGSHSKIADDLQKICKTDPKCLAHGFICLASFRNFMARDLNARPDALQNLEIDANSCLDEHNLAASFQEFVSGDNRKLEQDATILTDFIGKTSESSPQIAASLRCCLFNKLEIATSGPNSKKQQKRKLESALTFPFEAAVLEAYIKATDACDSPQPCEVEDYTQCLVENCIRFV